MTSYRDIERAAELHHRRLEREYNEHSDGGLDRGEAPLEPCDLSVPCKVCGTPTSRSGSQLCDLCWGLGV